MDLHESEEKYNELIARYLNGEATATQRLELEKWIGLSDDNATSFALAKMAWIESQEDHFESNSPEHIDVDAAWKNVVHRTEIKKAKVINFQRIIQLAAVFVIAIGVLFFITNRLNPSEEFVEIGAQDERKEINLEDGSNVELNTKSSITFVDGFSDNERRVQLKGEAFFDINRDTLKPFIIATNDIEIKVLGTRFNVNSANPDSVEVHVESGVVELMYEKMKITLKEGETGLYYKNTGRLIKKEVTVVASQFWRNRKLTFKRTQLESIVKTLNKLYDVNISMDSTIQMDRKTTVKFEDQDIELILDILANTLNLEVEKVKDDEFIIHNGEE